MNNISFPKLRYDMYSSGAVANEPSWHRRKKKARKRTADQEDQRPVPMPTTILVTAKRPIGIGTASSATE